MQLLLTILSIGWACSFLLKYFYKQFASTASQSTCCKGCANCKK